MSDRVDERNKNKKMRGNLIKWWNVNLISDMDNMEEVTETVRVAKKVNVQDETQKKPELEDRLKIPGKASDMFQSQGLEEDERELLKLIMEENDKTGAYESAMEEINQSQMNEANAIYERLLREQAEDEAKKQAEIEAAKLAAKNSGL